MKRVNAKRLINIVSVTLRFPEPLRQIFSFHYTFSILSERVSELNRANMQLRACK